MMRHDAALLFLPSPLWGGSARSAGVGVVVCGTRLDSTLFPPPRPTALRLSGDPPHKGEGKSACAEAGRP
jgi:hypothetical protein